MTLTRKDKTAAQYAKAQARRAVGIVAFAAAIVALVGCGGGASSTTSDPTPLRVTTSADINEMVTLLEEDEEDEGRFREEARRCRAAHPKAEYAEACGRPLERKATSSTRSKKNPSTPAPRTSESLRVGPMRERVLGIGGYFLRAADPVALAAWYRDCLGLDTDENGVWQQGPGPTAFAAFESETDYLGSHDQGTMINFRVGDLDAMVAQLRAAGADVAGEPQEMEGVGRFAWVTDPEGNRIELWQPA
jgi:predicted enzyme related to lactoylglutathione lyase